MKNFFKGIVVGIGGIAPGLSGSVLLIIFGLYSAVLDALGSIFTDFRNKISFLFPIVSGMFTGVLLFSKLLNFLLENFEMPTRFCFLGLILGTLPMFYSQVKKNGFSTRYYAFIAASAAIGTLLFTVNTDSFAQISSPDLFQCIFLGVAVAATAIIPGLDPAVTLSALGYYEVYVSSLADFDLRVLLPMLIGLALGGILISFVMSFLFRRFYTAAFSVVFGIFLSMIPNMLNESCILSASLTTFISLLLMVAGFLVSFFLGDTTRIKAFLSKKD